MRRSLGFDQVHLLDAHHRNIGNVADGIGRRLAFGGMELQVRIGREVGELRRRQVGNVAVIGIFGIGSHERALAPVGVGYFVVEIAGNAFENVFAAIPPRSLARTPCREIHKVGDAFGRLRKVPHPRIVGFVEARFGVQPLRFGHDRAFRGVDGLAGIRRGVGILRRIEAAQPEVSTRLDAVDHGQTRIGLRRRGVVGQQRLGVVEVPEDEFEHRLARHARIVAGHILGGVLVHDRDGQPLDARNVGVLVVERIVQSGQIQIELGAISFGEAQIAFLRFGKFHARQQADHIVARFDERIVAVPREATYGLRRTDQNARLPVGEPVISRTFVAGGAYHVARGGVRSAHHARIAEVEAVVVRPAVHRIGVGHVDGDGIDDGLHLSRRIADLSGSRAVGGEGLFDTARERHGADKGECRCFQYVFHFNPCFIR